MTSKKHENKSVYVLVGPKGSGKTYIGSLLEKEIDLKFLSVEKLGLENTRKSKLTGEKRVEESFYEEERELDLILEKRAAASFEATGSSEYFSAMLGRLRSKYKVRLVRIVSPLETCYRRIKQRDAAAHLPVSEAMIKMINEKAAKVDLDWDLTIDNSDQPTAAQIVAVFKKIMR
jgi:shikimate kinase